MKQRRTAAPATERGEKVIKRALEIMAQGCRGWSHALEQARKQVK